MMTVLYIGKMIFKCFLLLFVAMARSEDEAVEIIKENEGLSVHEAQDSQEHNQLKGFMLDDSNWKIIWHGSHETELLNAPDMEDLLMLTKDDEQYNCRLANPKESMKGGGPEYTGPNALQLMEPLYSKAACSYRLESYWTYEVCHGSFVRQYHEAKEGKETKITEYILGRYTQEMFKEQVAALDAATADGTAPAPKTLRLEGVDLPYLEVVYDQGTGCDLTGQPRLSRLRYICHHSGRHELVSLQESSSCQYVLVILSPLLCSHPQYRVTAEEENNIHCVPLSGSPRRPRSLLQLEAESLLAVTHQVALGRASDAKEAAPAEQPTSKASPIYDQKLVDDFLAGRHCLNGGTGWWRYEFCYGRRVEQFHVHADGSRTTIHLGFFHAEDHRSWLRSNPQKRPKPAATRRHVSHYYSGGSHCDEIGAPRAVEVKLKCKVSDSPNAVSLYLLEPRTCEYILGVESSIVCGLLESADSDGLFVERR